MKQFLIFAFTVTTVYNWQPYTKQQLREQLCVANYNGPSYNGGQMAHAVKCHLRYWK